MHLRTLASLAALAALLAPGCASPNGAALNAQTERFGPTAGESEISAAGAISSTEIEFDGGGDASIDDITAQVGYGYYYTDEIEFGGQVLVSISEFDFDGEDSTNTAIAVLPYGRYNFRINERSTWYAGAQLGYQQFEGDGQDENAFGYGVHGGFKSWLSPEVSFFVEPRYTITDYGDFDINEFLILLGFSYTL
jgi:opacity protein-like surface antigen